MIDRYDVLMNFTLNGDKYFATGVFMNEDEKVCELLCKAKFIKARPKPKMITIEVNTKTPFARTQIAHMNKPELINVCDEMKIKVPDKCTKESLRELIRAKKRKEAKK